MEMPLAIDPNSAVGYGVQEPQAERNALEGLAQYARIPRLMFGIVFLAGILIGSIFLGLLTLTNKSTSPDRFSPDDRREYIASIADRYWQTADLSIAQRELAGWNKNEVIELLRVMRSETTDRQARQHLAALSDALNVPTYDGSFTTFLFGHPFIVIAFLFSLVPLAAAIGYAAQVSLWKGSPSDEELAELVAQGATLTGGLGEAAVENPSAGGGLATAGVQATAGEPTAAGGSGVPGKAGDASSIAQAPGSAEVSVLAASGEEVDGAESELGMTLGDLSSVFEEEDVSLATLEQLSKGLIEIRIEDLVTGARNIFVRLKLANSQHIVNAEAATIQAQVLDVVHE